MGVIESEEAARRLARVIVSDIEIYNREKFQAGADLTAAIEEGRALFRSRVAPELLPVFTSVLEDRRGASRKSAAAKRATAASAEPAPSDRSATAAAPPRRPAEPVSAVATPAPQPMPRPSRPDEPTPRPVAVPVAVAPPAPIAETPATVASTAPSSAPELASESAAAPSAGEAPTASDAPAPVPAPAPAPAVAVAVATAKPGGARAGAIDTEEAAARLARVIVSDIQLYNAKKIASGSDLSNEIAEGRHLFKSRVIPDLLSIFENTLAAKGLGPRKRTASPAPIPPRARPPVAAEPIAAAAATTPRPVAPTPAPAVAARPSISAVKAPPAAQPRPGVTVTRRPTPAPHSVPMAMAEVGSGHHHAAAQAAIASSIAEAGSGRHPASGAHAAPSGRPGITLEAPPDHEALTPGVMAGIATGITPPPSEGAYPLTARSTGSRPPPTPPPVPYQARVTGPQVRIPTPVPPSAPARRERPPSLSEMPIAVDSGPLQLDPAHAAMPPQAVLDALPVPAPLPPLPVSGSSGHAAHQPSGPHAPEAPAPLAPPARSPTPLSLSAAPAPAPIAFAPPPDGGGEVASLRRGMSKIRLLLTITALGGAGGAIWYFLMR
jgi:hypothetical protein